MLNAQILKDAHSAAVKAAAEANAALPAEHTRGLDCGFAWVVVRPATSTFARFCRLKARDGGDTHYYGGRHYAGGWEFWKPGAAPTQSISVHEAGARAFRDVLALHGIDATVGSRLD